MNEPNITSQLFNVPAGEGVLSPIMHPRLVADLTEYAEKAVSEALIRLTEYECGDTLVWENVADAKTMADGYIRDLHQAGEADTARALEKELAKWDWKP